MALPRSPERKQFLDDVLTTAVEGGINYWAHVSGYKFTDVPGEAHVTVHEDETEREFFVDIDVVARGFGIFTKDANWLRRRPELALANRTNGEEGDYDADDADVILQLGIFGEVIYG